MPFMWFSIVGAVLGSLMLGMATYHALTAPTTPVPGLHGNPAVMKWAAAEELGTAKAR